MLAVGDIAPVFAAESTQGRVSLKEALLKGPVVLIFYPKDFTPGCTAQLCDVRDAETEYAALGATVLAVNPGTLEEHHAFAQRHGYRFPILHDKDGQIRKAYGIGKMLGLFLQQRAVFVIGPDGVVAYAEKGDPGTAEIVGVLRRFAPSASDYRI